MDKPIHFQWQNEFLCKTIYPMRDETEGFPYLLQRSRPVGGIQR